MLAARASRGLAAALLVAAVTFAVTRPLMRAVSLTDNGSQEFSWSGSAGILIGYVVCLTPGTVLRSVTARWWGTLVFAAGVGLLLYTAVAIGSGELAYAQAMTAWRWLLLAVLLAAMAAAYLVAVYGCWRVADRIRAGGSVEAPTSARQPVRPRVHRRADAVRRRDNAGAAPRT
jgi:hypothetical protein